MKEKTKQEVISKALLDKSFKTNNSKFVLSKKAKSHLKDLETDIKEIN